MSAAFNQQTLRTALLATPATPDALASLDLNIRRHIADHCDEVSAAKLINKATLTQQSILAGLKAKHTPSLTFNELRELELHVFREALGRLLKLETEEQSSKSIVDFLVASPNALGSRFNLVSSSASLSHFMRNGWATLDDLFPSKPLAWAELLRKDLSRALRVGELQNPNSAESQGLTMQCDSVTCEIRYPASFAVAERLACIPRELNYKTGSSLFGEVVENISWWTSGSTLITTDVVAGYFVGPKQESSSPSFVACLESISENTEIREIPYKINRFFLLTGKWTLRGGKNLHIITVTFRRQQG